MKSKYLSLLFVLSMLAGSASSAIYYVDDNAPGDLLPCDSRGGDPDEDGSTDHPFDGVQEAIDATVDGDTIIVAPGHYLSPNTWAYDEINFNGKSISLVSSAPTDFSVIEETVLCGVVVFDGTETSDCLLQGFKIQNHGYGGILGNQTQARISHCIISGNGPCGATVVRDCLGSIRNCLIVDNTTFHDCGVLPVISGCRSLVNCTIANNISGVALATEYGGEVRNCIIYGNPASLTGVSTTTATRSRVTQGTSISYSLIEGYGKTGTNGLLDVDPCFVRTGSWEGEISGYYGIYTQTRTGESASITLYAVGSTLVEGDYHLMSEGWRWSSREARGSHWYYDPWTSPAIDAGDPADSLREELERVPEDPEGRWGFNHAIDLGAYGGTTQASLAPPEGDAPGVGAVDLKDFWPMAVGDKWWTNYTQPIWESFKVAECLDVNGFEVFHIAAQSKYSTLETYWVYANRTFYATQDINAMHLLPEISDQLTVQYPQYPAVGATVPMPQDLFDPGSSTEQFATVVRGTLEEVHAGIAFDSSRYIPGSWTDVIAFRLQNADGTLGEPIAIFARAFGPLMLYGQPVDQVVNTTVVSR
ncbi:MAG: right-handed parallel beta-helix repeat-containing protein [Phycisphaerae bacterium]|nr:right-handed parallel beta-helix repeat-containing protein [Phycisphaerae bacterium]